MRNLLLIAAAFATLATAAPAYTTTRCTQIGDTVRCTTMGGGTISTTRCTSFGGTVRCSTF